MTVITYADYLKEFKTGRSKYKNIHCDHDGFHFDSKKERDYYANLRLLEMAKEVSAILVHPKYPITLNGAHICYVELDFEFTDRVGKRRYIDTKGVHTAVSKIKKKLIEAQYSIEVEWV